MAPKTSTFFDLKTCLGKSYRHSITPQEVCLLLNGKFAPKNSGEASTAAALSLVAAPRKLAHLGLAWLRSNSPSSAGRVEIPGNLRESEACTTPGNLRDSEACITPGSPGQDKAGLCSLPWEEHTEEVLRKWIREGPAGKDLMIVGGRRARDSPEEAASKALSRVLRHEAGTVECPISPEGWVRWRDLLNHPRCRDHRDLEICLSGGSLTTARTDSWRSRTPTGYGLRRPGAGTPLRV